MSWEFGIKHCQNLTYVNIIDLAWNMATLLFPYLQWGKWGNCTNLMIKLFWLLQEIIFHLLDWNFITDIHLMYLLTFFLFWKVGRWQLHYWNFESWMSLESKNSFSNCPMGFSRSSKIQINVLVTILLVLNTFQNILDGFASFHGQKIFTNNCSGLHYFLTCFSYLASLGTQSSLENSETWRIIFLEFIQMLVFVFALHSNLKLGDRNLLNSWRL